MISITPYSKGNYLGTYCSKTQIEKRSNRAILATQPHLQKKSLLWISTVLRDGWGDLKNCLNAIQIVKEKYPHWDMRVLVLIENRSSIPFKAEDYGLSSEEFLAVHYADPKGYLTDEYKILRAKLNQKKIQITCGNPDHPLILLGKKIDRYIAFFKTCDLQIGVSTPPWFSHPDIDQHSSKFVQFCEYAKPPDKYTMPENTLNMGVSPSSCGIYIFDKKKTTRPTHPLLKRYFKEKIYFNYGKKIESYVSLVSGLNPNVKELNIITNLSREKIEKAHFEGFDHILFVDKEGSETDLLPSFNPLFIFSYFDPCTYGPNRVLRLINPFPLCHEDMLATIERSEEPVGITGNASFSESLGKFIFYNNRKCLQYFWNQLIFLAHSAFPQHLKLIQYLNALAYSKDKSKKVHIDPADLPLLKKQWADLVEILRRDWNVAESYLGEINRRLLLQRK